MKIRPSVINFSLFIQLLVPHNFSKQSRFAISSKGQLLWNLLSCNSEKEIKYFHFYKNNMKFSTLNLEKPRSKVSISNNLEFSNYVRVQNDHNVIPILWTTLEEDLILSFPTWWNRTWSPIQNGKIEKTKSYTYGIGNKKQLY